MGDCASISLVWPRHEPDVRHGAWSPAMGTPCTTGVAHLLPGNAVATERRDVGGGRGDAAGGRQPPVDTRLPIAPQAAPRKHAEVGSLSLAPLACGGARNDASVSTAPSTALFVLIAGSESFSSREGHYNIARCSLLLVISAYRVNSHSTCVYMPTVCGHTNGRWAPLRGVCFGSARHLLSQLQITSLVILLKCGSLR